MRTCLPQHRLTPENAIEIHRRRWLGEPRHSIARSFSISPDVVGDVLSGRVFPEVRAYALRGR